MNAASGLAHLELASSRRSLSWSTARETANEKWRRNAARESERTPVGGIVCKMGLTGLHDTYGSWHFYIRRSLFGISTFLFAEFDNSVICHEL